MPVPLCSTVLRFFFVKTLKRHDLLESVRLPKEPRKLPTVLSQGEVTRLIESASNLMHRAILMTLYSTGMRRAEFLHQSICAGWAFGSMHRRERSGPFPSRFAGFTRWRW